MLNLINDAWIPAVRADGTHCRIAPWQVAERANPVVELTAPRADFQGALYQFLIGLLQTTTPPTDSEDWDDSYEEAITAEQLKVRFSKFEAAFELFSQTNQPAFLQDIALEEGEAKDIAGLLIDAPGGKTIKDNLDFFIKAGTVKTLCPACAALALFTLQTNAPAGGVGHRVGLRGGGPLTTLIRPVGSSTLWQKLWLNVLVDSSRINDTQQPLCADVFPWLGETRLSDKTGRATYPEDVSSLQMYWGMPRRIRLQSKDEACHCDLCGEASPCSVSHYITRNYGTNYEGAWQHPLTPYRIDPKNKQPPLSLKGQKGGLSYRHWLGLLLKDSNNGDQAAKVVRDFYEYKALQLDTGLQLQLWCFGYDMDNMKARCWYEHMMPVLQLLPSQAAYVQQQMQVAVEMAREAGQLLRNQVKQAWFRRPKDVGGDISFIDAEFYHATNALFYSLLEDVAKRAVDSSVPASDLLYRWGIQLNQVLERLFDSYTLNAAPEALDLQRIIAARTMLFKKFNNHKLVKQLRKSQAPNKEMV